MLDLCAESQNNPMEKFTAAEPLNVLPAPMPPDAECPELRETAPEVFESCVTTYAAVLSGAREPHSGPVASNVSATLQQMAEQMGRRQAAPRDVIAIHTEAVRRLSAQAVPENAQTAVKENRRFALELMGRLALTYRSRASRMLYDEARAVVVQRERGE